MPISALQNRICALMGSEPRTIGITLSSSWHWLFENCCCCFFLLATLFLHNLCPGFEFCKSSGSWDTIVSSPNFHWLINVRILVCQHAKCECSLWKFFYLICVFWGFLIYYTTCLKLYITSSNFYKVYFKAEV